MGTNDKLFIKGLLYNEMFEFVSVGFGVCTK